MSTLPNFFEVQMKTFFLLLFSAFALALAAPAFAQNVVTVPSCTGISVQAGPNSFLVQDTSGVLCGLGGASAASPATGTETSVASSATSVTILASNVDRKEAMIYNDSTANLYLRLSATAASTTAFTIKIAGGGYYEIPAPPYVYTGELTGIWDSANGSARVTEITP